MAVQIVQNPYDELQFKLGQQVGHGMLRQMGIAPEQQFMKELGPINMNDPSSMMKLSQKFLEMGDYERAAGFYELGQKREEAILKATTGGAGLSDLQQELRDIATNVLGCDYGDSACASQAWNYRKEYKRAGPMETAQIGDIKELNSAAKDIYASRDEASFIFNNIDVMEKALDSTYTGFGGEAVASINTVAALFGMNEQEAANAELFRSKSIDQVLAFVQKTKGAISNREMELFIAAAPGLGRTREGNKKLLSVAKSFAEFEKKKGDEFRRWRVNEGRGKGLSDWQAHVSDWEIDNRVTLPEGIFGPTMANPSGGTEPLSVKPSTEERARALGLK